MAYIIYMAYVIVIGLHGLTLRSGNLCENISCFFSWEIF